jgi:hypothetical protein
VVVWEGVRELANEQFSGFLVATDFSKGDGTRAVTMGLLDATGGLEQRVSDCDHDGEGGVGGWGGKRTGADLRAAFEASCLRGAFPPVDLRAVCYTTVSHHHHQKFTKKGDRREYLCTSHE